MVSTRLIGAGAAHFERLGTVDIVVEPHTLLRESELGDDGQIRLSSAVVADARRAEGGDATLARAIAGPLARLAAQHDAEMRPSIVLAHMTSFVPIYMAGMVSWADHAPSLPAAATRGGFTFLAASIFGDVASKWRELSLDEGAEKEQEYVVDAMLKAAKF